MTAKEKAEELRDKCIGYKWYALVAVDEILKEIYSNSVTTSDSRRLFWQEVREELVDKY